MARGGVRNGLFLFFLQPLAACPVPDAAEEKEEVEQEEAERGQQAVRLCDRCRTVAGSVCSSVCREALFGTYLLAPEVRVSTRGIVSMEGSIGESLLNAGGLACGWFIWAVACGSFIE